MAYPKLYEPILKQTPLPLMIVEALKEIGTIETPGARNNPRIMGWRNELTKAGAADVTGYSADSVPWCGLFMAVIAHRAGKFPPKHPLWALNWAMFGTPGNQPCLGDVLVFVRSGGGHVGLYVAEDRSAYHVLGGNQSDKVSITRVDKKRLHAVRRPTVRFAHSPIATPYVIDASGKLSTNEA